MTQSSDPKNSDPKDPAPQNQQHPTVTEHPEQRRQEETGHEDASDPAEVGRPSGSKKPDKATNNAEHAA